MKPTLLWIYLTVCNLVHEKKISDGKPGLFLVVGRMGDKTVVKATSIALKPARQTKLVRLVKHLEGLYVCRFRKRCRRKCFNRSFSDHFWLLETSETSGGFQTRRLQAEGETPPWELTSIPTPLYGLIPTLFHGSESLQHREALDQLQGFLLVLVCWRIGRAECVKCAASLQGCEICAEWEQEWNERSWLSWTGRGERDWRHPGWMKSSEWEMGGWVEKKKKKKKEKESEGEGAGLYGLRPTTKENSAAPKLYSVEEENGSR